MLRSRGLDRFYGPRDSSVAQDLMGHITLQCMQKCRAALDDLSLEEHGIDGPRPQRAGVLAGSWGLSKWMLGFLDGI